MTDSTEEDGYSLVMPFVATASNGGPYADEPYVCGYEMGLLDGTLGMAPSTAKITIHAGNRAQADLVAMKHGYTMTIDEPTSPDAEQAGDWLFTSYRKTSTGTGNRP